MLDPSAQKSSILWAEIGAWIPIVRKYIPKPNPRAISTALRVDTKTRRVLGLMVSLALFCSGFYLANNI